MHCFFPPHPSDTFMVVKVGFVVLYHLVRVRMFLTQHMISLSFHTAQQISTNTNPFPVQFITLCILVAYSRETIDINVRRTGQESESQGLS